MDIPRVVILLLAVVVHFLLARAIRDDADRRERRGEETWFVAPIVWAAATLLGGVLSVLVYWMMHYSSLAVPRRDEHE